MGFRSATPFVPSSSTRAAACCSSASTGPRRASGRPPGGGVEGNEGDERAIARELAEELGLDCYELGPCIWLRTHWFLGLPGWAGQVERLYLVRAPAFEPGPRIDLRTEGIGAVRWWTLGELEEEGALFAPRRLPGLLRELVDNGPPGRTVDVGV